METLIGKETAFKARILQKTSQNKFKLSVYSEKLKKEIGLYFVQDKDIEISDKDINKVIHFKAKIKKYSDNFYIYNIKDLRRNKITYSREERRSKLSKYINNNFYEFTGTYNYTRENDNRSLFTNVKLKTGKIDLNLNHVNIIINKELKKNKTYKFKAKVVRYQKEHASGYFYGLSNIKNIKEEKDKEVITISKKEYLELLEIKNLLKKLKEII